MMTATSHVLSVMDRERRAADAGTGSGSFPDVLIELRNGEVLHGHRCILSMCSPFFASQFNVAEEGKVLKLKLDEPPERIKKIIEIAYTGQLNYPDEKREPLDELVELLEVDQDNVAMFQTLISLLESDVKLENVYKTINIATRFNLKEIVEYCWDFIDDHALDIMSSDIICGVDYDKMMETVRCRTFQQSAIGVFKTMLKWQRAHPEYNMKYEDFFNVVATARMNVDDFDVSPAGELQSKIITEWAEKMKQMRALEAQVRQFCGGEENWPLPMSSKRILVNSSLTSYTSQQRFALWLNKAYSDLVLRDMKTADKLKTEEEEKEDEEVHAHRCILAAASSFFRAVAVIDEEEENDGEDNNNTEKEAVYLEGVSSMAFKQLVKFIYRGGLDLEELQIETIIEFYEMAQKYLDDEILSAMHDYLIADLRLENVYEVFVIAKQFNVEELLRPVWSFMHHNAIDIMYSDTLYYWQEEHLINVLSSSTFQEQPFYVFCAVRSFLEANPDAPRRKEMLDLVDLANIDEGDLIDAVGPSRLYSKRVIRSAIKKSKLRARQREKAAVEDTTTEEKPEEESK